MDGAFIRCLVWSYFVVVATCMRTVSFVNESHNEGDPTRRHSATRGWQGYTFDMETPAKDMGWLMGIVQTTNPLNKDAERELSRRKRDKRFRVNGPRTFIITAGGMGAGKGYSLAKIFGASDRAIGKEEDYVVIDPDDIRQGSQTFQETVKFAKENNKRLPRNLIAQKGMFQVGRDSYDWLQLTRNYVYKTLRPKFFDARGTTSVIYDSSCKDLKFCKELIDKAVDAGFERIGVMWAHVEVNCSFYRAAVVRPKEKGRFTPEHAVRDSWAAATANAPKLQSYAKQQVGRKKVRSYVNIRSNPPGKKRDEHDCADGDPYITIAKGSGGKETSEVVDTSKAIKPYDPNKGFKGFDFDFEKPAEKMPWLIDIVSTTNPLNKEAEREFNHRNRDPNFRLSGPRTFIITAGGMGAGKGYTLGKLFEKARSPIGKSSDFVTVDPDDIRQGSQTFSEMLEYAKRYKEKIPKNLLGQKDLFWVGQDKFNWLGLTRSYVRSTLMPKVFDKKGKSSVIYDSSCKDYKHCESLLEQAVEAGYERVGVLWAHVELNCSLYRAVEVRPKAQGRFTPDYAAKDSWENATINAPKLFRAAERMIGRKNVKASVNVKSEGDKKNRRDAHDCYPGDPKITVTAKGGKGGGGSTAGRRASARRGSTRGRRK